MNEVQPIRKKADIQLMKKYLGTGRNRLLFTIGINVGLRISDLLELKVSDLLFEDGSLRDYIRVNEEKTDKNRRLTLNSSIKKELKACGITEYSDAYLFPSRKGNKPISRVQAWRILNDAATKIGIEEIGTHTLRKTFGYHAYKQGAPIALLMRIFKHSSAAVTLAYIGIQQDSINDVYNGLNL